MRFREYVLVYFAGCSIYNIVSFSDTVFRHKNKRNNAK